jgi:hypothetical protein
MPGDEYKRMGFSVSDIIYLKQLPQSNARSADNRSILARITTSKTRGGETNFTVRIFIDRRNEFVTGLHTNATWTGVRIMSLTTTLREYTVLTTIAKNNLRKVVTSFFNLPLFMIMLLAHSVSESSNQKCGLTKGR